MNWLRGTRFRAPWVLLALLSLLALAAWAQTNPLQDRVRVSKLYRYGRAYEDSSLNLGGIAGPLSDTLQAVRPAKWTTLFFSVNGTMGSGSLQAIAWCGSRYSPDDNILVGCDTLAIGSTGRYAWDWNVYTSDIVLPVFSVGVTVGGAVTVDSIMVVKNW